MLPGIKNILNRKSDSFKREPLSIEEGGRRRLFALFLLLIAIPLFIFGIGHIKTGLYSYVVINYSVGFLFIIFIFFTGRLKDARVLYRIVLTILTLLLLLWVNRGSIKGYTSLWVIVVPLIMFFLMGKREGFIWTVFAAGISAVFMLFPALSMTGFVYDPQFIVRHFVALLLIILFTYSYEDVREKYKNAMEAEQHKLKEQQNRLEELVAERTLQINEKMLELEEGKKRYNLFADNTTDLIWSLDRDLKFNYISPSVTKMYGYTVDEASTLSLDRLNTPESYARMMKKFGKQINAGKNGIDPDSSIILQLEHVKKDGSVFPVELKTSIIRDEEQNIVGYAGISRDISDRIKAENEREKMQEQLAQAQKMEAVGTLAGGLAHDFNNFLGGIIGSFELIKMNLNSSNIENRDTIERYLDIGLESSKKSADLIKQLLALSRRHEIQLVPTDIRRSLEHVYELSRNSIPKSVEIDFHMDESPMFVMGEPAQMEQVLLNLCINASHAMTIMRPPGERQGGRLTIKGELVKSDNALDHYYTGESYSGSWARISINDTGVGMDKETKKRIFEPFYSTKNKNIGTGLGLAISYSIVQKHGGFINVYSEPGKGSCFTVYLPVFDNSMLSLSGEKIIMAERGSGTVLVIDDEIFILNIARGFLENCGYDVLIAEGPDEGIELYRANHGIISAVMVDYSMPGRNGLEVYRELKAINGNVRALLSSGMLDAETRESALKEGIVDTVNKPFTAAELSLKIKKVAGAAV